MAELLECSVCKGRVSSEAAACPHCGHPLKGPGGAAASGSGPAGVEPEMLDLLRQGKKIEAIKRWRAATGSDLASAKRAVDDLQRTHGIVVPASGCGSAALLLLLALGAAAFSTIW